MVASVNFLNRKRIKILLTALSPLGAAQFAGATEAHLSVMQQMRGVDDEVQLFRYNGMIGTRKHASLELGYANATKVSAGVLAEINGPHVGAYISRDNWLVSESQAGGSSYSLLDSFESAVLTKDKNGKSYFEAPQRPVEILAGFGVGSDATLGLRFAIASYKNNQHTETSGVVTEVNRSADQVEIGAGFHKSGNNALDFSATITPSSTQTRKDVTGTTETSASIKASTKMEINARWLENESASGLYGAAMLMTRTAKASTSAASIEKDGKFSDQVIAAEFGYAGIVTTNNAKAYVAVEAVKTASSGPTAVVTDGSSAAFSFQSSDETAKKDTLQLNGKFAGEATVYGGFGLMAGMSYVMYGTQTTKDNTTGKNEKIVKSVDETADSSLWSLGMFYKVDALRVDAQYSRNFLYNGPYIVAGNATSPWLGRISASYQL